VVEAFLTAARAGDVDAIIAVLAPDVARRGDRAAVPSGRPTEVRGARTVAEEIAVFGWNSRFAELALVNGDVGIVVESRGRLLLALAFTIDDGRIVQYELIGDPLRLQQLDLAVLDT
jgi:ketosteroid isomerase-like protein